MECFLKSVIEGREGEAHRYFVRFGKGDYKRRFLLSFNKGARVKLKGSFELANDFVKFLKENKELKYSGKILSKEKIAGQEGKKKAGLFAYEIENAGIKEFENAYYYLLDANDSDFVLKIKKSLPKPGKDEEKIDEGFCSLDADMKYWPKIKETFFWDVAECKKAIVEHELKINDIVLPKGEKDPAKMREMAKRKGTIVRKITADGKESSKEFPLEV